MRFVQNHRRVIRQHAPVSAVTQGEIGKEQVMIHDDNVGLRGAVAHARDEAGIKVRTLLPRTGFRPRIDVAPERKILGQVRQLGAIAGLSSLRPVRYFFKVIHLIEAAEDRRVSRTMKPLQAKIVVAALHVGGSEFLGHDALEKRNVFLHQLFLQILGAGRDDHSATSAERRRHRRNQISKRLARSRCRPRRSDGAGLQTRASPPRPFESGRAGIRSQDARWRLDRQVRRFFASSILQVRIRCLLCVPEINFFTKFAHPRGEKNNKNRAKKNVAQRASEGLRNPFSLSLSSFSPIFSKRSTVVPFA